MLIASAGFCLPPAQYWETLLLSENSSGPRFAELFSHDLKLHARSIRDPLLLSPPPPETRPRRRAIQIGQDHAGPHREAASRGQLFAVVVVQCVGCGTGDR
jgi:hypothetical protein